MADSNASGFAALDDMIARCQSLEDMPRETAPKVAAILREIIAQAIAAGTTPEGEAWKPTVDGHLPLQGAMSAITVEAVGTTVVATLSGHYIFHHMGRQSGKGRNLQRAATAARKAAKAAGGVARKIEKKLARATDAIGKRKTAKGKVKARLKAARIVAEHSALMSKVASHEKSAKASTAAHAATVGVGGLPARPMIPRMLAAKTGYAIREFYKARWEAKTAGAEK